MNNSPTKDQRGQVFTLDIMLALVLIAIVMGISADTIDMASYKISGYTSRFSLERVTNDAADMLVKTPGSPQNWVNNENELTTPGLAAIDSRGRVIPNTLSIKKIQKLAKDYNSLIYGKVLPPAVNSRLTLYPSNPSLSPIQITDNDPKNANEVAVANRTVLINLIEVKTVIYNQSNKKFSEICPNSVHADDKWTCQHLNISSAELSDTDFYIILDTLNPDDSSLWLIDRPEKAIDTGTGETFNSNPVNINKKLSNLLGNDNTGVLWLHVKSSGNAYILSVPKGIDNTCINLNSVSPEPWFFVLEVWY